MQLYITNFCVFHLIILYISLYLEFVNPSKIMEDVGVGAPPSNTQSSNGQQRFVVAEQSFDDFSNWKTEAEFKNILPNVIVSYNGTVKVDMVSDPIAWNIKNLTQPLDSPIPTMAVAPGAKVKAVIWIKLFKEYVMKYMKNRIKMNYLQTFNSEKYRDLRNGVSVQMNWKEMCRILSPMTSKLVRNCTWFILV